MLNVIAEATEYAEAGDTKQRRINKKGLRDQ